MSRYFAYCNFNTSGVKSFADDLAVRNGPVSSRVALLLRSAEGKPSFASISPMGSPDFWRLVGVVGFFDVSSPDGRCRVVELDLVEFDSVEYGEEDAQGRFEVEAVP